jgi:hypothetical protein
MFYQPLHRLRWLSVLQNMRLQLYSLPAAGYEPPFRARALVRTRRAWFDHRNTVLQFLEVEGLGPRSLERSLVMVLGAARVRKGGR